MGVQSRDEQAVPTLLQDRSMATAVYQLSLCPKMDLLAVVFDSNSVAIFRTNWQRLATIPVSSSEEDIVTCLAWSPDGANIVVGTTTALSIYSVDRAASAPTSRAKRTTKEATEPIASMEISPYATTVTWSPCFSELASKRSRLAGLSEYPDRASMVTTTLLDDFGPSGFGLLFIGDCEGGVTIMVHNLQFTIAHINIMPPRCYVERIYLTSGLRHCLVVGCDKATHGHDGKGPSNEDGICVFRAIDLEAILEYWPEINRLGKDVMAFRQVSHKLNEVHSCIKKNWTEGAIDVLHSSISKPLSKLITDFAEEREFYGPWDALHDVFCGSRMSGAMLQFLAAELSENGAKEALRGFRSYIDEVDMAIMAILPTCENMVFRASEHRGLARLTSRFAAIGVDLAGAGKLFEVIENLCLQLGEFACESEKKSSEGEAFLAWLVLASARAGGETIEGKNSPVAGNLEGREALLVSQFFKTMTQKNTPEGNSAFPDVISESCAENIVPLIKEYRQVFEKLVRCSSSTISAALVPGKGMSVPINMSRAVLQQKCFIYNITPKPNDETVVLVCIVDKSGRLVTIRHSFTKLSWHIKHQHFDNSNQLIHDAALFSSCELAIVTSEAGAQDERSEKEKATFSLNLLDYDNGIDSFDSTFSSISEDVVVKKMPDSRLFDGSNRKNIICGQLEMKAGVSLALNSNLELASVLLCPRRILVFDLLSKRQESV